MQKFMPTKKTSSKKAPAESVDKPIGLKVTGANVVRIKDVLGKFFVFQKITSILSIIFYVVWIPVGIFFIWFIIANFRLGAFDQLMGPPPTQESMEVPSQTSQTPAETSVPGVGTVNVDCVQKNLSEDSIIQMVQDKGTQNLTDEEKSKLQPCIIEAESASPEASPEQ